MSMQESKNVLATLNKPWNNPWPENGVENVSCCPVCGAEQRKLLYDELVDNVFHTAPGKWLLYQCQDCRSAYLDPRPTPETIGLAYREYYTHSFASKREVPENLNGFRLLRRALANGYTNLRYGTNYSPVLGCGAMLARVFPSQRERLDKKFRWLPKPLAGQKLLDVGCGNGDFLLKAYEAGWKITGVDFDPSAVEYARCLGLDVHVGSVENFNGQSELFDVVTLSHVIEHIHEPMATLNALYRLLKPDGTIYIDTPNVQSRGFSVFGKNWRGVESPRHLVLFSILGIQNLLLRCGFKRVEIKRRRLVTSGMFLSSFRLSLGLSPYSKRPKTLPVMLALKSRALKTPTSRLEFITLIARK